MEELQDAIEDAQYVNAIATQEDGPRPVLPWDKPTEEQLDQWKQSKGAKLGTLDWTLSSPIGLFLFSSFVKQQKKDYVRINFCEEVLRFKKLRGKARWKKAQQLVHEFLSPPQLQTANTTTNRLEEQEEGEEIQGLPPRTEIVEYDLERLQPENTMTTQELEKLMEMGMDYPTCAECVVGLRGPVRKEILLKFAQMEDLVRKTPNHPSARNMNFSASAPASVIGASSSHHSCQVPLRDSTFASISEDDTLSPTEDREPMSSPSREGDNISGSLTSGGDSAHLALESPKSEPLHIGTPDINPKEYLKQTSNPLGETTPERPVTLRRLAQQWLRADDSQQKKILPDTSFDSAEKVVMESLHRQYWDEFLESEEYAKLLNFLWYQDRQVVPDDFFVMRVLGRGGFGLVTGTCIGEICRCC